MSHTRRAGGNDAFPTILSQQSQNLQKEIRMLAKIPPGVGPQYPQVVVLVGATGDLARRKLLPGLFHLSSSGFIPGYRIIGVSLDDLDDDGFRRLARDALTEFSTRKVE